MYVTNIWGIFFCFVLPTIIMFFLAYLEGVEDGKKMKYKKKRGVK